MTYQEEEDPAYTRRATNLEYFESVAGEQSAYRRRHKYYWDEISDYVDYFSHQEIAVLEIGCGTGELLGHISAKKKVGIDYSPGMIAEAQRQFPGVEFHVMDAKNIDLGEKFDLIIISNLIGYLDDIEAVFQQLHRVSHERTKVIVTYYNYLWQPLLKLAENLGLKRKMPPLNWLSRNDINNLLFLSGFDVYRTSMRMLIPFYIPLISTIFNRYIAKLPIIRHLCINGYSFAMPQSRISHAEYRHKYTTSVVIPARNESGNIENAVLRLPKFGKDVEIIFIEGNSTDDTWQTIQAVYEKYRFSHNIKIGRQDGKGKGDAVRKGFGMATGDILMILDADLTVPPEDIPKFYDAIASGKGDFINGSRLVYKMEKKAMRPLNLLGNKFFSILFSFLLEQPFKDTLCGTKVTFRTDYEKLIQNRKFFGDFDPFGDYDLIFGAYKLNLKIVELPIRYRERTYGDTNISRFRHGFILLQMCAFAARKIKFR
ncbi:MAG: bifunctional class I SAM-dependent methyltransferase/glycosyltransferase family 2 protein [Bacteroidota bacterium]|nr:bifunctional class I SAM-dependent methyltransferase/glycosyltransferase family 2 protein [Bacteroidota bacterium]